MVTTWLAQDPPPHGGGGGVGFLLLVGLAALLWWFVRVQWRPLHRCTKCPKPDEDGFYSRCRHCGGKPERLRPAAWVLLRIGVPVPRARHYDRQHVRTVPKDYRRE
jgi:hypothetical protein